MGPGINLETGYVVKTAWVVQPKVFVTGIGIEIDISDYYYATADEVIEYVKWCKENVGWHNVDWYASTVDNAFYFRLSEDAIAFKLRFGLRSE